MSNRDQNGMTSFYRGALIVMLPVLAVVAVIFAIIGNWGATILCAGLVIVGGLLIAIAGRAQRTP